ncbi:hypothetical protein JG688_00018342, partial [Phytophthora aleatoria]
RHREGDEAFTPGDKVGAYEEDASEADTQNVKPGTLSCLRLQASTLLTKHVHGICCMADIQRGKEEKLEERLEERTRRRVRSSYTFSIAMVPVRQNCCMVQSCCMVAVRQSCCMVAVFL